MLAALKRKTRASLQEDGRSESLQFLRIDAGAILPTPESRH
jgi:hypothetical protein